MIEKLIDAAIGNKKAEIVLKNGRPCGHSDPGREDRGIRRI